MTLWVFILHPQNTNRHFFICPVFPYYPICPFEAENAVADKKPFPSESNVVKRQNVLDFPSGELPEGEVSRFAANGFLNIRGTSIL